MNYNGVMTTQMKRLKSHVKDCAPLQETGVYRLRLDHRSWGKYMNLTCYFTDLDDEGKKYTLQCWRHSPGEVYGPKKSDINFAKVPDGTSWLVTVQLSRTGKPTWWDAVPLE